MTNEQIVDAYCTENSIKRKDLTPRDWTHIMQRVRQEAVSENFRGIQQIDRKLFDMFSCAYSKTSEDATENILNFIETLRMPTVPRKV